ncbi:hypothetical protein B0H17DRAFT_709241 [Mycena rosella]|uniref:Uncharacterized protein n=1 Tax=Mycena rosella TaxID=1033263 RepID=A0AAD7DA17_MYCRO|nr:hypothetical protein B0H17DRAFT_709241 [Mycena rosella]
MPHPHDSRDREPSDARAALMERLLSQFPPYLDGGATRTRSRHLQAERPSPYRVPTRRLPTECRKNQVIPSLGCGAFLKDETLRSPEGVIIRAATGASCSSPTRASVRPFACGRKQDPPDDCHLPLWDEPSVEVDRALQRDCAAVRADSALDGFTPLRIRSGTSPQGARRSCSRASQADYAAASNSDSPPNILEHNMNLSAGWTHPPPTCEPEGMSEVLCIEAADKMFAMFIDESYMEEDYRGLSILSYSTSI